MQMMFTKQTYLKHKILKKVMQKLFTLMQKENTILEIDKKTK